MFVWLAPFFLSKVVIETETDCVTFALRLLPIAVCLPCHPRTSFGDPLELAILLIDGVRHGVFFKSNKRRDIHPVVVEVGCCSWGF